MIDNFNDYWYEFQVSKGDYDYSYDLQNETKFEVSSGVYYYNNEVFDNDYSYDLQNETRIEVSEGDFYYNNARDSYNAVSDLLESETEIEI